MRKNMLKIAIAVILVLVVISIIMAIVLRDKPGEMMEEAYDLRDDQRLQEAADLFGKVAIMYPTSKYADIALFEEGFSRFVIIYPKADNDQKGVLLMLSALAFTKVVEEYDQSEYISQARKYLAEICIEQGDDEGAVVHLQAVISLSEDPAQWEQIYSQVASAFDSRGEYSKAAAYYRRVIAVNLPGRYFENAHMKLAEYYQIFALENEDNPQESYQKIIDLFTSLLKEENKVSAETEQSALLSFMVGSYIELEQLDKAEEIISLLKTREIQSSDREILRNYEISIDRLRNMGNKQN
jgi:tetratricopeptide (TPR) repeat protein